MKKLLTVLLMLMFTLSAFSLTSELAKKEKPNIKNVAKIHKTEIMVISIMDTVKKMFPLKNDFILYDSVDNYISNKTIVKVDKEDYISFSLNEVPLFKNYFLKDTEHVINYKAESSNLKSENKVSNSCNFFKDKIITEIPVSHKSKYFIATNSNVSINKNQKKSFSRHQFTELHSLQNDFFVKPKV